MNFESMLKLSVILRLEGQSRLGKVAGFQFFQSMCLRVLKFEENICVVGQL